MKNLKIIFLYFFLIIIGHSSGLSEITQSAPTTIMQEIAMNTSFSSTIQNTPDITEQIQTTTSTLLNKEQLIETVNADAIKYGLKVNQKALAALSGDSADIDEEEEEKTVLLNTKDNIDVGRTDLEPDLNTIVYRTGLLTLTKKGGDYNQNDGEGVTPIFDPNGVQQGEIIVYIDFKKQLFWGDTVSKMKLSGKDPFENSLSGGSAKITELPINMQLSYTVKKSDGLIMSASNDPSMYADRDPAINSLLNLTGNMQPFTFHEDDDSNTEDRELVQETISNAAGGDGNVIVGAAFQTSSTSSVGEGTISFESATGAIGADAATFGPTIVRYEATGAMIGSSYKGTSRTTTTAVRE